MPKSLSTHVILALLAALGALLFAWFAPLPRLVLGDEEKSGERMPENRALVQTARLDFEKAQSAYKDYVGTHDIGAALTNLESAIKANAASVDRQSVAPVLDYLGQLRAYASAGESYYAALHHYDDELMAWTRSLGATSEDLRPDTWPIVEYLKLYPPPEGQNVDFPNITASDVTGYTATISAATPALQDVDNVRAAGRSIEYRNSLHAEYGRILAAYDTKAQAVASSSGGSNLSSSRLILAIGLNVLLGAITLAGLASLFLLNTPGKQEAQL